MIVTSHGPIDQVIDWLRDRQSTKRSKREKRAITEGIIISDKEIDELVKILKRAKVPLTNTCVAKSMKIVKGEASKRVSKAVKLGIVSRTKSGKHVAISLLH